MLGLPQSRQTPWSQIFWDIPLNRLKHFRRLPSALPHCFSIQGFPYGHIRDLTIITGTWRGGKGAKMEEFFFIDSPSWCNYFFFHTRPLPADNKCQVLS